MARRTRAVPARVIPQAEDFSCYSLSHGFWSNFSRNYWEQRPLVLRTPFARSFATPSEAFQWFVRASAGYRPGGRFIPMFYIDQLKVLADIGKHLPKLQDGSASAYAERLARELKIGRFGLVVDDIHLDENLWLRLRAFVGGLFQVIGIPGEVNALGFLGNYAKTPFGVHKGDSTNFMFVVEGRKRIRAWPDSYFRDKEKPTASLDYERFLSDAITLEGEAGDLLYWPSDYWHIGEDAGGLSIAISLQVFPEYQLTAPLFAQAAREIEIHLRQERLSDTLSFSADRPLDTPLAITKLVNRAIRTLHGASRDPNFRETLAVLWLKHVTSLGFHNVPPPLPPIPLSLDDEISGDSSFPIVWMFARNQRILCAANGHCFALAAHPNLPKLIARLNSGVPVRVRELIKQYSGSVCRAGIRFRASSRALLGFLERLAGFRAIRLATGK